MTDDFKYVGASTKEFDVEEFRRITLRDFNVFPDTKIDFERIVSQGDTVVVEYVMSGTYKGKLGECRLRIKELRFHLLTSLSLKVGR